MTLDELILTRRSVRKYKTEPIGRKALEAVLEAGRLAPSARNAQNWHFTVVQSEEERTGLVPACRNQRFVGQAPAVLVVWCHEDRIMQCGASAAQVDCSIALSFMMLKAWELGLGTCWLGAFDAGEVAGILGLPAGASVVAVTPLGYPDEAPAAKPRKPLEEVADIRD